MINRLTLTLLIVSAATAFASVTPAEGVRCELTSGAKLFLGQDGDTVSTQLEVGDSVTLKVSHSARWMVKTANGQLGFLAKDFMEQACTYLPAIQTQPAPAKVTPALEASDIMETAAALDATKAAAEGTAIDRDVLRDQIAQVARTSKARRDARGEECGPGVKALIRVAVYDLELSNIPSRQRATTEALLRRLKT